MTIKWPVLLVALLVAILSACERGLPTASEQHRLEGVITAAASRIPAEGVPARVRVARTSTPGSETVYLAIYADTDILLRGRDGSLRAGSVNDLGQGARVLVWTTGEVYLSDPPEFDAARIEVLWSK